MSDGSLGSSSASQFLRIPPFPGAQFAEFECAAIEPAIPRADAHLLCELIRAARVGGDYWGKRPALPVRYLLCRVPARLADCQAVADGRPVLLWADEIGSCDDSIVTVRGACDPWHMLQGATMLVCRASDPARTVAALLGIPVSIDGERRIESPSALVSEFSGTALKDPFTGHIMTIVEAIELCGTWRRLIDSNRDIGGGYGFAFWKQDSVATLLWAGDRQFRFLSKAAEADPQRPVAIWRSRTPPETIKALEAAGVGLIEVEDGFLRSSGLGADCIPPLSIVVDRLGAYFDPSSPSELELLLEKGAFDPALLDRAEKLRTTIIAEGLGKYEASRVPLKRFADQRTHVLVPGQVEDDRSILTGGAGIATNLELLRRVRENAPDAFIIYKPHPDVLAGHRKGSVPEQDALRFADRIVTDAPISSLLDMVDEVHVNTSLTGFEALLRQKRVITHGVPFYAGWGLTTDLGPVPDRRTARRTVDELVAAALILYPRYLDPITRLPCSAEVAVDRLSSGMQNQSAMLVTLRRLQGRVMRRVRTLIR